MRVERILAIRQLSGVFSSTLDQLEANATKLAAHNAINSVEYRYNDPLLQVAIEFLFQLRRSSGSNESAEGEADSLVFEVKGQLVAVYELRAGDKLDDESLNAFANINGPLNLVPYWREFVASSLVRAGLPAYEVPVFNPMQKRAPSPNANA